MDYSYSYKCYIKRINNICNILIINIDKIIENSKLIDNHSHDHLDINLNNKIYLNSLLHINEFNEEVSEELSIFFNLYKRNLQSFIKFLNIRYLPKREYLIEAIRFLNVLYTTSDEEYDLELRANEILSKTSPFTYYKKWDWFYLRTYININVRNYNIQDATSVYISKKINTLLDKFYQNYLINIADTTNDELEDCIICCDNIHRKIELPCEHIICGECLSKIDKCPICRQKM